MSMAVEAPGGPLPWPVLLDEGLQRPHQLTTIVALAGFDRREDRVAEQPEGLVVLEREQQLKRAEVLVGSDSRRGERRATAARLTAVAVPTAARRSERDRLEGAPRFVEAPPRVGAGDGAASADPHAGSKTDRHPRADALGDPKQLRLREAYDERARE